MQGHRFINVEHLLFSLSLSRVAKPVQRILDGKGLKRNIGKHSKVKVPSWKIYDLTVKVASENGEHVVRLKHFASAVIAWKLQNDPTSKMAMDKETSQANGDVIGNVELLEALKNRSDPLKKSWKCGCLVRLPEGCYEEKYKAVMCYELDGVLETDSFPAARLLHGDTVIQHNGAALIEDSKALMAQTGTTISHIPRLANQSADSLSRFGAGQEESLVITYDIPEG
ncbi:hypothetical protein RHSIM_Rhsim04G0198900 [Rhododendron simsii]|uniref:Uncharacterized protein n=1 Tax=Rhododendron simsii TaxID=118357 RepID=A0A834H5S5_RHOSS|nr:hypothetical protein RHSIM_Rhsim04G0198900 [Rhododendron simsii]